jgi:uncharacterized protein (DUF1697 family)
MTTYIALLRAINLAGKNMVGMADLRDLMTKLGLQDGQSLLQSGNLVFRTDAVKNADLERRLEDATKKRLGLEIAYMVRTADEWKALIAGNPFPDEAERDPGHLLVVVLKSAPDREQVASLQKAIKDREIVRVKDRQAYIVYPDGVGRSRLTNALIEKNLGTRGTARNWNTVLKLRALALEAGNE